MTSTPEIHRFSYTAARTGRGQTFLRPLLPLTLSLGGSSLEVAGLVDSGADVNVLPFGVGVALGAQWSIQSPILQLSGNLAQHEARGLIVDAVIGEWPPVKLAFAWTRAEDMPLLLGQVNFFAEFDVCFFRADGVFEVRRRRANT